MKQYNFQDLILSEETDVIYVKVSDAEDHIHKLKAENKKLTNLYEKLKGWHSKALRMQAIMAEDLEPYLNKIEDLEAEDKKMKEVLGNIWVIAAEKLASQIEPDPEYGKISQYCAEALKESKNVNGD